MKLTLRTTVAIIDLIKKTKESAIAAPATVHNLNTLSLTVLANEFSNELDFFDTLFTHELTDIPTLFQARCALRQTNPDRFISFADNPATLTNRLYFQIAILLFNPTHLQALMAILMPKTTRCFHWKRSTIRIEKMKLLSGIPIESHALENCVFVGDAVFPLQLNASPTPSFQNHLDLYKALHQHPDLQQKFYTHNTHYKTLAAHIHQVKDIAPSLREMLLALLNSLRASDSSLHYANTAASIAIGQFSEYFNALPKPIQHHFTKLPTQHELKPTIAALFNAIDNSKKADGICIHEVADALESTLKSNNRNNIFDYRPTIDQETLDHLQSYYDKLTLNRTRETTSIITLPTALCSHILKQFTLDNPTVFIELLKELPAENYSSLFKHCQFPHSPNELQKMLNTLDDHCRDGIFDEAQRAALLAALIEQTEPTYPDLNIHALKRFLLKSLALNLSFSIMTKNPSINNIQTFYKCAEQKLIDLSAELQDAELAELPPVVRLRVALVNKHISRSHTHKMTPFLSHLTGDSLQPLVFKPFPEFGMPDPLVDSLLTVSNINKKREQLSLLFSLLEHKKIAVNHFCDAQHQNLFDYITRMIVKNQPPSLYYKIIINDLPENTQLQFLGYKLPSGMRVIDVLIQRYTAGEFIPMMLGSAAGKKSFTALRWLLGLLTDKNLKNVDELINATLGARDWAEVKSTLANLLKKEPTRSRYISFSTDNIQTLFLFYLRMGFKLTRHECYQGIVATAKLPPSPKNFKFIGILLKHYFKRVRARGKTPSPDVIKTLLDCALAQSSLPSPHGGVLFNPVLLLLFHSKMRRLHKAKEFSRLSVTLGAPINRTLSIDELMHEVLHYIPAELLNTRSLTLALYTTIAFRSSNKKLTLDKYLTKAYYLPLESATHIKNGLQQFISTHYHLRFDNYVILLKNYFRILRAIEKKKNSTSALQQYLYHELRTYTPAQRLILLNIKPHGATNTLGELYHEHIKPIMSGIYPKTKYTGYYTSLAELEEQLQFTIVDWKNLLKQVFSRPNIAVIEYLLVRYSSHMQRVHQQQHLLPLYFESVDYIDVSILYRLHLFGFQLAHVPSRQINQYDLNRALDSVSSTIFGKMNSDERRFLIKERLVVIDALINAGANINPVIGNFRPPLLLTDSITVMRRLLDHGADINAVTSSGRNVISSLLEELCIDEVINTKQIRFLLRHRLSPAIINHCTVIHDQPITLLSALHEHYQRHGTQNILQCMEAALSAGANPLFWQGTDFAFVSLKKLFPNHAALLSFSSAYERLTVDKSKFELISAQVDRAIIAYRMAQRPTKNITAKNMLINYDIQNKISHLVKIQNLFKCAFSIDDIQTALDKLINTFIDSDIANIITVKRQPDLCTHEILFELIRAVYGKSQGPQIPPPPSEPSIFKRYFSGKTPQHLLITHELSNLLTELHPDQFSTFDVFALVPCNKNAELTLDRLTKEQMIAFFNQFFINAALHGASQYDCLFSSITHLKTTTHITYFYTKLFRYRLTPGFNNKPSTLFQRVPKHHRDIFFKMIPFDYQFSEFAYPHNISSNFSRILIRSLIGQTALKQFSAYNELGGCAVPQPLDATAETFAAWEAQIDALYQSMPKCSAGDTIFHKSVQHAERFEALCAILDIIPSCFDRITILLMKNSRNESALSYLKQKYRSDISSDILSLLLEGDIASISLRIPFIREICLQHPEFFLPIFYLHKDLSDEHWNIEYLHMRHRGVLLLDHALKFVYESKNLSIFKDFTKPYQDYFKRRAQLLMLDTPPKKPEPTSLFYAGYETLLAKNQERLDQLASYTDESVFEETEQPHAQIATSP